MRSVEHRRHIRVDAANLLAYTCRNDDDEVIDQGMGRTLNVSESGILLETYLPIDTHNTISLSIGFKQRVIDINGKILWCRAHPQGMFRSGIEFFGIDAAALSFLRKYIEKITVSALVKEKAGP